MYTHFYLYFDTNNRIIYRDSFRADTLHQCYHKQMEQDIARLEDKLHQAVKAKTITILTSRLSANADEHFDDADYCLACTASGLTEAETDVMLKLRQHKSNREIADDLNISGKTVETHLKNITKKLKVNGRGKLILEIEKKAQSFRNPS